MDAREVVRATDVAAAEGLEDWRYLPSQVEVPRRHSADAGGNEVCVCTSQDRG